jgi:glycosyltransferase involved in cell wall biosynthesis
MKLVYLASSTLPSRGADAVHVMNMCKAFAECGLEVTLIARKNNNSNDDVFKYYDIEKNLFKIELVMGSDIRVLGGFIFGRNVLEIYNKLPKQDVVYARSIHSLIRVINKKQPFFFESHWKPTNVLYHFWESKLLKKENLKSFIFISKGLERIYKKEFPKFVNKFNVLHDACNTRKTEKELENKRLQVGYVGSFFKGNGFDLIPIMAQKMPEVDFHIIGGKEPILSELKKKFNLDNLMFHGHVPYSALDKFYSKLMVMLAPYQKEVPSLHWMSPMKIFEYMSYKKAIASSDFPVIREVLNEENSILIKSDSIEDWVKGIDKLKNKKLRETLADNAYNLLVKEYTWKSRAERIINMIEIGK